MRRGLIVLPQKFPIRAQQQLNHYLIDKTKHAFDFSEDNHFVLIDNEFMFLNALSDFSPKNLGIDELINRVLDGKLFFENGEIKNFTGSFGFTFMFTYEGEVWIKKVPYYSSDDFNREYAIANKLCNTGAEFVPIVKNYNNDDGSYIQEIAIDSLDNYINSNNNLSDDERFKIVVEIVLSIKHIHSLGIIHRDLHPGNVFLFRDGNGQRWKVSDFGLAYDTINGVSCVDEHNGRYGDRDFISPEQKKHLNNATFLSDIYSIGRLMNFIYTKKANDYNHMVGYIATKCCSRKPEERYENVSLLLDAINSYNSR